MRPYKHAHHFDITRSCNIHTVAWLEFYIERSVPRAIRFVLSNEIDSFIPIYPILSQTSADDGAAAMRLRDQPGKLLWRRDHGVTVLAERQRRQRYAVAQAEVEVTVEPAVNHA